MAAAAKGQTVQLHSAQPVEAEGGVRHCPTRLGGPGGNGQDTASQTVSANRFGARRFVSTTQDTLNRLFFWTFFRSKFQLKVGDFLSFSKISLSFSPNSLSFF